MEKNKEYKITTHPVLTVRNISLLVKQKTTKYILKDNNFSIDFSQKSCIGITGPSGAGKTTLAKLIARLIKPSSGEILWGDIPINKVPIKFWRKHCQYVFQDMKNALDPEWKIENLLLEGPKLHKMDMNKVLNQMDNLLALMFPDSTILSKFPPQISEGEAKRVGLIRSLLIEPDLLILDEPTRGVDLINRAIIESIIFEIIKSKFVIIISHEIEFVKRLCSIIVELSEGRIVEIIDI